VKTNSLVLADPARGNIRAEGRRLRKLHIDREVAGVVLVYVAYYLGAGTLIPYFPLWLKDRQLDAVDIAFVLSVPAVVRVLAAPFFGYFGDAFGKRRVIRIMSTVGVTAAAMLSLASPFWAIMLLTGITYICWQSMPLQMDSIAIGLVRRRLVAGYGSIRAFGSTAFIAATFIGTGMLTHFGTDGILGCFIGSGVMLLLATTQVSAGAGKTQTATTNLPVNVWLQPKLVSVLVAAGLVHGAHAAFISFGALHMRDLGYSNTTLGIVFATATGAEILMFFSGYLVTDLLRPIQWIALGAGVATLRWIATAFVDDPFLLTLIQLTHALTFSGTYMGMIGYLVENVDQRQMASAQGIYIAMFGAFNASLTMAVGAAFDRYGGQSFLLSAMLPAAGLAILGLRRLALRKS
jgi:PPP family 3-phenylpropionic acid transporter